MIIETKFRAKARAKSRPAPVETFAMTPREVVREMFRHGIAVGPLRGRKGQVFHACLRFDVSASKAHFIEANGYDPIDAVTNLRLKLGDAYLKIYAEAIKEVESQLRSKRKAA